jgi:raffinose/stachyose/melibiose transport system permease protein
MSTVPYAVRRRQRAASARRWLVALAFILPALALYGLVVLRPLVDAVRISFYDWDGFGPPTDYVGVDNYRKAFDDPLFWTSLKHNLVWMVISLPLVVGLGLMTAVLLAGRIRGRTMLRTLYFLPVVQASAVIALAWRWVYSPIGPVTTGLDKSGLGFLTNDDGWVGNPSWALPSVAVAAAWAGFGFSMVIFLAGIQSIDPALYDAVEVDGAGPWQRFRYVTMPGLRSVTTTVLVLGVIGSFLVFDLLYILTPNGGVIQSTQVLGTLLFYRAFSHNEFGYGAALSVVLMVIIFALSWLYLFVRERRD